MVQLALNSNMQPLNLNNGLIKTVVTQRGKVEASNLYDPNLSNNPRLIGEKSDAYFIHLNNYIPIMMWLNPSTKLLNLYNNEYDLRKRFFVCDNYTAEFALPFMPMPNHLPGYITFFMEIQMAPTAGEMYLIQAESQARTGNIPKAMQTLNTFRKLRFKPDTPSDILNLTASNARQAIKAILDERFRESPFSLRWLDIRRCNFNTDATDDITIERNYYPVSPIGVNYKGEQKNTHSPQRQRHTCFPFPKQTLNFQTIHSSQTKCKQI